MFSPTQKYIAKNISVTEAMQTVLSLPVRYTHHKTIPGIWKCGLISKSSSHIVLQLADESFEPPRGNVRSDAPFLYIQFLQIGADTLILWKLRWQLWKTLLVWITSLLLLTAFIFLLWTTNVVLTKCFIGGTLLFLSVLVSIWLVQNIRHDKLTIQVFGSILQNNL